MYGLNPGVYVAMITPWTAENTIDWKTLEAYVDALCHSPIAGIVVAGTTGEGMALNAQEYTELIQKVVACSAGKKHIMAGVSGVYADPVVSMMDRAQQAGAHSALVLTPFYIRPSQQGLIDFFNNVHEKTSLPMVLYNNPGRTCVAMDVETVCQLGGRMRIVGIKDSTADLSRPSAIMQAIDQIRGQDADENSVQKFMMFSGEDATFVPFVAGGGHGIISVQAGIVPSLYCHIWQALQTGQWSRALALSHKLIPLHRAMGHGVNPGPIKYAASLLGWGRAETRFPLGCIPESGTLSIAAALDMLSADTIGNKPRCGGAAHGF
jgi:4-hydroxy-tetrahydrodipicolinate synthase